VLDEERLLCGRNAAAAGDEEVGRAIGSLGLAGLPHVPSHPLPYRETNDWETHQRTVPKEVVVADYEGKSKIEKEKTHAATMS